MTIESVTPIAPLVQEKLKPEPKPKVDQPEQPTAKANAVKPIGVRPQRPIFGAPAQLSQDIEPIDDEEEEEFQ